MSVTYNNTVKNTRLQAVIDAINYGSPNGYLEIGDSGMINVLATINFNGNCGSLGTGVLNFGTSPPMQCASAAISGTAAAAVAYDAFGTWIIHGLTVGLSATDIVLSSTSIVAGQPVTITAASITHG